MFDESRSIDAVSYSTESEFGTSLHCVMMQKIMNLRYINDETWASFRRPSYEWCRRTFMITVKLDSRYVTPPNTHPPTIGHGCMHSSDATSRIQGFLIKIDCRRLLDMEKYNSPG